MMNLARTLLLFKLISILGVAFSSFLTQISFADDSETICRFYDDAFKFRGQVQEVNGKLVAFLAEKDALGNDQYPLFEDSTWATLRDHANEGGRDYNRALENPSFSFRTSKSPSEYFESFWLTRDFTRFKGEERVSTNLNIRTLGAQSSKYYNAVVIHDGGESFCKDIQLRVSKLTSNFESISKEVSLFRTFQSYFTEALSYHDRSNSKDLLTVLLNRMKNLFGEQRASELRSSLSNGNSKVMSDFLRLGVQATNLKSQEIQAATDELVSDSIDELSPYNGLVFARLFFQVEAAL